MNREKVIIIGGGVGPLAGTVLHRMIIENTATKGSDQEHPDILHISRASDIPDRTEALFNGNSDRPAEGMFRSFKMAASALAVTGQQAVGGIPCNTFHAPEIYSRFRDLMKPLENSIKIVNMLSETAEGISAMFPDAKRIGLLSTTGTRLSGVYNSYLEPEGYTLIQLSDSIQTEIHDSIYNSEWGLKAVTPVSQKALANFRRYADMLAELGAEIIIPGCTEIPLALAGTSYKGIPLADPMLYLARALIREAAPEKLKTSP